MSNLRIGFINLADLATLTVSPALGSNTPAYFLQNDARGLIAQATSTASQDITGTWGGTAYTISQFTLWRHNLVYSDTIRLILYPNADWTGTPVYDSTALAAYSSGLFTNWGWAFTNRYFTPAAAVKSFKITIAASATALQASRLGLFAYIEAPINPQEGFTIGPDTNAKQSRSESGSLRTIAKADWRAAQFEMQVHTEAYRAIWAEVSRYCGITKSFVASAYPGDGAEIERDHTIFGKFDKPPAMKLYQNRFDFSMRILEL